MAVFRKALFAALLILLPAPGLCLSGEAGEADAGAKDVWADFAGMAEELEGETLELRDELIPAHMAFLASLEKAVLELPSLSGGAERELLAWTRAEYLLETSFRLLESTGEYEAFLKVTAPLAPGAPDGEDDSEAGDSGDLNGGLAYRAADGRALSVKAERDRLFLVDAETGKNVDTYEGVTASPAAEQPAAGGSAVNLVRARAAWLRARAFLRTGKTAEAKAGADALGLIRDWAVAGPLEAVSEDHAYLNYGLADVYARLDAGYPYQGKNGAAYWKPFSSIDPLGTVYPGAMFRGEGRKTAFFLALVHSPADQPAVVRFGSTSSAIVCVNHLVIPHAPSSSESDLDQEAAGVWMRRGWNVVLVRTSSDTGDWAFGLRLTSPDGTPFRGRVVKPDAENLARMIADARAAAARSVMERYYRAPSLPESGGLSVMSAWLREHPEDARGNFYLGSFLVARRMMEGAERFDREMIFGRAMRYSGRDPFFTLMAARAIDSGVEGPDREENLRLVLLRSVADRGSAAALADIGRLYLDVMRQPRRADEYADMALSVNPMSLRAGVLDYDVAVAMGWSPVAETLLDNLVNRHPSSLAARLRLGRAALEGGRHRQALTEFHAVLAADALNREALDGAVLALGMLGQTSAAVDLLAGHIEKFPYDFSARLVLAELHRTLGRDGDASETIAAALAAAPDDPDALAMREDLRRETWAETGDAPGGEDAAGAAMPEHRPEIDLSPAGTPPANGWEYLYFQTEDRMDAGGAILRNVSFAVRIYTARAARMIRHLSLLLDSELEKSVIRRLDVINADGARQRFTPPAPVRDAGEEKVSLLLPPLQPGMAVEAEVTIRREHAAFLGEYFGHTAPLAQLAPVRLSRYMFIAPRDREVHFKSVNGAPEAMVVPSPDGKTVTRIWEMSNLPAFLPEPWSPGGGDLIPCVQVSSFGDWNEFARWYWRLIGAQYNAPPELRMLARRMAAGGGHAMEKLDRAATWVARNIGGRPWEYGPYAFRPINARSILSRLSADGKDRALLLCLLAREYGLEAWPVLARVHGQRENMPGSDQLLLPLLDHFNHSLALVRSDPGGDVFLDASSPNRPPAVMPARLFGSPGLAVSPAGAEMIHIPDGGAAACEWREEAEMVLDEDGGALWEEDVAAFGTAAENLRVLFSPEADDAEEWTAFLASVGADPSAAAGEFENPPAEPSRANWSGRARLRNFATVRDNTVFLAVPALPGADRRRGGNSGYPLSLERIARSGERKQDAVLPHGFRISRKITIRHPAGWRLVNPVEPFSRTYPFGTVSLAGGAEEGGVRIEFAVEVPGRRIAAADFPAFRETAAALERWICPELVWEKP